MNKRACHTLFQLASRVSQLAARDSLCMEADVTSFNNILGNDYKLYIHIYYIQFVYIYIYIYITALLRSCKGCDDASNY